MTSKAEQLALWRFEIIAPLLVIERRGELKRAMEGLAARWHEHPTRGSIQLSARTIESWLYSYRRVGLAGLEDQKRRDLGKSRAISDEIAAHIETLVSNTDLDGPNVLKELKARLRGPDRVPSLSSLYRFVRARGLALGSGTSRQDHRRYGFDLAGECWQGDVMYGPSLPTEQGKQRRTFLIAIIDDATRVIPHAEFYFEQHLRSLKDCLKQAFIKRGLPKRLYFDNGRIFKSRMILGLVARLGIHLIHSRPYRPQGRAKIERFFGTVRSQFLKRLDVNSLENLAHLNRLFNAWVEGDYHIRPHRGLEGKSPFDQWIAASGSIRPLSCDLDLDDLFLETTTRRIAKDGTFTLKGAVFEARPSLIGQRVEVRFDPFDLRRVLVCPNHESVMEAFPLDPRANRTVRRDNPESPAPPRTKLRSLEDEARRHEQSQEEDHGRQEES